MMLCEGVLTCSGAGSEADKKRRGQRGECRGHDAKIDSERLHLRRNTGALYNAL